MKRQLWVPVLGVILCGLAFVYEKTCIREDGFTLEKFHNADAKFLGDRIITSVDEGVRILNSGGEVLQQFDGISASWIYVSDSSAGNQNTSDKAAEDNRVAEYVAAYSNHANETHILRVSEDNELLGDETVLVTDMLAIDPILVKIEDGWLLTHTTIDGTINNPDPEGENGIYTVKLYQSEDLSGWKYVTDIISREQNLEDGDIRYKDGVLYYFFEKEKYDKGPSAICVMSSKDGGQTWSGIKELLPAVADNEMASCEPTENGWRLYVSSDYACMGESYQGASVYYADFTRNFEPICIYQLSAMPDNEAVRLYEAKEIDGQMHFLFARNFLTDCDLLLRILEKEE